MSALPDTISAPPPTGLVVRTAERYGIEPGKLLATLKATAFRTDKPISNEQMMSLLIVAERHRLDPFTKQIYAYPDKWGGIVPVVGIDGWLHIINTHPMFDGMSTQWDEKAGVMTCTIRRKDRSYPIVVPEYLSECRRPTDAWKQMPLRMMRHKATMQCGRYAFGFSGIFDDDEATDILRGEVPRTVPTVDRTTNAERFAQMVEPVEDITPTAPTDDRQPPTLADYIIEMASRDVDDCEGFIEDARRDLTPDEHAQLVAAFMARMPDEGDPQ